MYDAIEDPYTYKNSTVLVNKLDLHDQAALDAFEAEISSARAEEPLPDGSLDFTHYRAIHHHLFQDVYGGRARFVPSEYQRAATRSVSPKTLRDRRSGYSTIYEGPTICGISTRQRSQAEPLISWQS
jgi:fido (protein-threonine AMPylation protein)